MVDGYVYIGKGNKDNPLKNFWDQEVYSDESMLAKHLTYNGDSPQFDYYIDIPTWDAKFPELAKQYYNSMNKEVTLKEIKGKLEEAKKLVGKKIKSLKGRNAGLTGEVKSANLYLEVIEGVHGEYSKEFFAKNGYIITLDFGVSYALFNEGAFDLVNSIIVTNHQGVDFEGVQYGTYWTFGCADIPKSLIKASYDLLSSSYGPGNRQATKITIGAADFDLETLKKLVDADTNK